MRYAQQYVRSAESICQQYDGAQPLALFLKDFFKQHKKFGSKDRKHIAHICYTFYRLGKAVMSLSFEERIRLALFLCEDAPGEWQELFGEGWLSNWPGDLQQRIQQAAFLSPAFNLQDVFPWQSALGGGIAADRFISSHFRQPDLFLRIRPGHTQSVKEKLRTAGINFREITANCIALPNGSKIDELLELNREVVVQDLNSQRTGELLQPVKEFDRPKIWDACAASGGKSIMATDLLGNIDLTVSDLRENILHNLRHRFREGGISASRLLVTDLSKRNSPRPPGKFDLIIADVPCTGSGTWARTPEQLYFFNEKRIAEYSALQQTITENLLPQLDTGGYLLYMTCSVFRSENEQQVEQLQLQGLAVTAQKYFMGYDERADSLFAALLRKSRN